MMTNKEILMDKLYKMMSLLLWETETAWDYGAGFPIRHSEVHLLDTIKEHEGAKASCLAASLGITRGAVSQGTKKLLDKRLVEDYKLPDNRKEGFFRLTPWGKKCIAGTKNTTGKWARIFLNIGQV